MNGMEDLIVKEPEDKTPEQMEKQQLVSVIVDQQKELNRMRGLLLQNAIKHLPVL